jgi:AbrB family transcriptional regulator (stage V sporulation protein T)
VSGAPRRELLEKAVSPELEELMEERKIYQFHPGSSVVPLFSGGEGGFAVDTAAPILSEGDVLGCVLFTGSDESGVGSEVDCKLVQSVAGFLGKHMES